MARLKAGPTHIMDILITVATTAVGIFFVAVVLFNIPWGSLMGRNKEESEEEEDEDADSAAEETENQREKVD